MKKLDLFSLVDKEEIQTEKLKEYSFILLTLLSLLNVEIQSNLLVFKAG